MNGDDETYMYSRTDREDKEEGESLFRHNNNTHLQYNSTVT